jgi:hypothetical protein
MDELLPSPKSMIFDIPLYLNFSLSDKDIEYVANLITYHEPLDAYCPWCQKETVFHRTIDPLWAAYDSYQKQYISVQKTLGRSVIDDCAFEIIYRCSRNEQHDIRFHFVIKDRNLMKIGQYPSLAEFALDDLKQYRKILDEQIYSEYRRAIGLNAHGIGIGAFVYLRRVFERLVESVHQRKSSQVDWNEEDYQRSKMEDRINILKGDLPPTLVELKILWPILSKGIHELSEEDCLKYFPSLKTAIEMILFQEIKKRNESKKELQEAQNKRNIANIKSEIA